MLAEQNSTTKETEDTHPSVWSLLSYYCGVFAILPIIGILLGILAVFFGGVGLWKIQKAKHRAGIWICRIGFGVGLLAFIGQSFILYTILLNP